MGARGRTIGWKDQWSVLSSSFLSIWPGQSAPSTIQVLRAAICSLCEGIALWGHGDLVLGVRGNLQEKAPFGFSGNDGGKAGVASFEHEGALVETKARLLLFFPVALHTVIRQDGGNVLLVGDLSLRSSRKKEACPEGKERGTSDGFGERKSCRPSATKVHGVRCLRNRDLNFFRVG